MRGALSHETYRQLRAATLSALPSEVTVRLRKGDPQAIEVAMDLVIRSGKKADHLLSKSLTLLGKRSHQFHSLLSIANGTSHTRMINASPASVGSYLASRLLLVGARFKPEMCSSMYALCDAVRGLSYVEALRWQFVLRQQLDTMSRQQRRCPLLSPARDIVRQSKVVLAFMSVIQANEENTWERFVLQER
jgi:hypothetical protein